MDSVPALSSAAEEASGALAGRVPTSAGKVRTHLFLYWLPASNPLLLPTVLCGQKGRLLPFSSFDGDTPYSVFLQEALALPFPICFDGGMAASPRDVWMRDEKHISLVLLEDDLTAQEHPFLGPSFQIQQKTSLPATGAFNITEIGEQKGTEIS